MICSIFIASRTKSWWTFVFFYDVGFPAGTGICFWIPLFCGWEWFPNHRGLVTGIILGGFGMGSFVFGFVTTHLVNPTNLRPWVPKDGSGTSDPLFPKEVADRVPHMFEVCLICWSILALLSALTISRNPEFVRLEDERVNNKNLKHNHEIMANETQETEAY